MEFLVWGCRFKIVQRGWLEEVSNADEYREEGREGREEGNYDNRIILYPLPSQYLKTEESMY